MKTVATILTLGLSLVAWASPSQGVDAQGWGPPAPDRWGKNNFYLIDEAASGFALYRMSTPTATDLKKICALGIQEIYVLSGTAAKHELAHSDVCPGLKVVYNEEQDARVPLTAAFLQEFDRWVEQAQAQGKKIAFRCECGCHRTGRLAAYYQMKFQHLSVEDAQALMLTRGKWMALYPTLFKQVQALADFIHGRTCSVQAKYCVGERP